MRCLIVEDDPTLSAQLAQAMQDAGFVTDCAGDGEQGEYLGATPEIDLGQSAGDLESIVTEVGMDAVAKEGRR